MKKYMIVLSLIAAGLIVPTACEDNRDEYLSDFDTILYLRDSGEQLYTVYKTGEDTTYIVSVDKAGWKDKATAQVKIRVMDDAALTAFNVLDGSSYKAFPAELYSFTGGQLDFAGKDLYKRLPVELYTDEMDDFLKAHEGDTYVVPIEIYDSNDSINAKKSMAFVKPEIAIPYVGFETSGYTSRALTDTLNAPTQADFSYPIVLPLDNRWNINVDVAIDQTLLDAYNTENGLNYTLLPEEAYTMNNRVQFTSDKPAAALNITVDRTKLTNYGNYVLPLRLEKTDNAYFPISPTMNTNLAGISYVPDKKTLNKVALKENMISIYPDPTNEGSIAGMLDGNLETYYHSNWGVGLPLPHWLTFALDHEVSALYLEYTTRHNNNNGVPYVVSLEGSLDGVTFKKFAQLSVAENGLPTDKSATYQSEVQVAPPMKYFRFSVEKAGTTGTGGSFALAEFRLWTD
ncbi:MAG: DUF1735 domain-containing protein [Prevotellaceae bacterium]|jgi:hypothetical protein|nr:DUF1735 domain-containing protein [Prevotellaceae bacterium]